MLFGSGVLMSCSMTNIALEKGLHILRRVRQLAALRNHCSVLDTFDDINTRANCI